MMTNSLYCVSSEVRKLPYYDGLTDVDLFLDEFESEVPQDHCFQALELALRATPTRCWGMHKDSFAGWQDYRRMMKLRFWWVNTRMNEKYNGRDDPHDHLAKWTKAWGTKLQHSGYMYFFIPWIPSPWTGILKRSSAMAPQNGIYWRKGSYWHSILRMGLQASMKRYRKLKQLYSECRRSPWNGPN